MDMELQNEMNRTRHLLHMKKMIQLVKDKKAFDNYLKKMERMQRMRALGR
jgi:hypothetical protein